MTPEEQTVLLLREQTVLLRWYVGATIVIALCTALALFGERIRAYLERVSLQVAADAMVSTPFGSTQLQVAHFARLRVSNSSRRAARDVEVVLESVSRKGEASGSYAPAGNVFGLNLEWSHFARVGIMPQIGGETSRTVDLGHVLRPTDRAEHHRAQGDPAVEDRSEALFGQTLLKLGTVVQPYSRQHLLLPGEWQIVLRVSGANVQAARVTVDVKLTGTWNDDVAAFAVHGLSYTVS